MKKWALPLALATSTTHLLMVESKTRKSVFLQEAVRALELDASVATARENPHTSAPRPASAISFTASQSS